MQYMRCVQCAVCAECATSFDRSDLKILPRSYPARPSLQITPDLGDPDQVVRVKAREQRRVLRQLREVPEGLRMHLRDECRPTTPPRWWWGSWLKRLAFSPKALHRLHLTLLPHPRRHPSRSGLPTTGETVDLARLLLGAHFLEPLLSPGAHSRQRPRLAIFGQGTCAAPTMETAALLTRDRPLPAETVAVAYSGTAALLVFAVGTGLCQSRASASA
jgi:hypothetical protein